MPASGPEAGAEHTPRAPVNRLLAALPADECTRLAPVLEPIVLRYRQVLYNPGDRISHVYFPTTAVVSLLTVAHTGVSVETSLVGDDGLVGLSLALGSDLATNRAILQVAGGALRMTAPRFRTALAGSRRLRALMNHYTEVVLFETAQAVLCNRLHDIYARCARWLLETHDRVHGDEFLLTHEFLASMLVVRRASVSLAAGRLQRDSLIRYHRGRMTVLSRAGLEAAACTCYRDIRNMAALHFAPRPARPS
jgi:CRP-like cAMP-binding protein